MNNNENPNVENQVLAETSKTEPTTKPQKKNTLGIILLVLGFVLIGAGIGYAFLVPEEKAASDDKTPTEEKEENNDNFLDDFGNIGAIQTEYTGMLMFEPSKQITDVFNITVPVEFSDTMEWNNSIDKELDTGTDGVFNSCNVELSEVINFNNANLLATSMAKYHSADATLTTKEINGISWYNFQYESLGTNDTYITEKDGRVFMFVYEIGSDANKEVCNQYMPGLINSVSYK